MGLYQPNAMEGSLPDPLSQVLATQLKNGSDDRHADESAREAAQSADRATDEAKAAASAAANAVASAQAVQGYEASASAAAETALAQGNRAKAAADQAQKAAEVCQQISTQQRQNVYTKSESDAHYAQALLATESGTPLTVEPDGTGTPLCSLQLAGITVQAGSGAATAENPREFSGAGQFDQRLVLEGKQPPELFSGVQNSFVFSLAALGLPPAGQTDAETLCLAGRGHARGFAALTQAVESDSIPEGLSLAVAGDELLLTDSACGTAAELCTALAQNPLTVWYRSAGCTAQSPVYLGLCLRDGEESRTELGFAVGPLAQPLFAGDCVMVAQDGTATVQRRWNVLTLTGKETWKISDVGKTSQRFGCPKLAINAAGGSGQLCTQAKQDTTWQSGNYGFNTYPDGYVDYKYPGASTLNEFSAYLAAQSKAGTPVRILYPLATTQQEHVAISEWPLGSGTAGTLTLTAPGMVTATFHKNLTAAVRQLQQEIAKLSA